MSDDYHFHLDPADLIEARLTREEWQAVGAYRRARASEEGDVRLFVVVVPVSVEMLDERMAVAPDVAQKAEHAALVAVLEALGLGKRGGKR